MTFLPAANSRRRDDVQRRLAANEAVDVARVFASDRPIRSPHQAQITDMGGIGKHVREISDKASR
jgi:hypothetical protein